MLQGFGQRTFTECGVTMSVAFQPPGENDEFKGRFNSLISQAQERLSRLKNTTPQEHYFLKTNHKIIRIKETLNNHIFLRADIVDDLERHV